MEVACHRVTVPPIIPIPTTFPTPPTLLYPVAVLSTLCTPLHLPLLIPLCLYFPTLTSDSTPYYTHYLPYQLNSCISVLSQLRVPSEWIRPNTLLSVPIAPFRASSRLRKSSPTSQARSLSLPRLLPHLLHCLRAFKLWVLTLFFVLIRRLFEGMVAWTQYGWMVDGA